MSSPIRAILDFLAEQYHQGKQYRTINSYRSAISMTHFPIDGVVIGKHPLITRLMGGVYNRRPPQPKYSSTWDVGQVLRYIGSGGPNQNLTLKQLTHKVATLFALSNASRVSEIHGLDLRYMERAEGVVSFKLTKLTKTARPGKALGKVHYLPFEDTCLCPVSALDEYLNRTECLREHHTKLFLAVVKPYKPVSKASIARWIKSVIQEAGVDKLYGAHSTRGASSTAAFMQGMSLADIMKIADWSSDSSFKRHYFRPLEPRPKNLIT